MQGVGLVAVAVPLAFCLLWALGANDVANALGTSVGSKALKIRQAIFIAGIFEFLGSSLMGSHVATTLGSKVVDVNAFDSERQYCVGMVSALGSAFIWLTIGTWFGMPLSSTHTVLGGVVGFSLVAVGSDSLKWGSLGKIALSWVVSPLAGALISYALYLFIHHVVLVPSTRVVRARRVSPVLFGMTLAVNVIFILQGGPKSLRVPMSNAVSAAVFLGVWVLGSLLGVLVVMFCFKESLLLQSQDAQTMPRKDDTESADGPSRIEHVDTPRAPSFAQAEVFFIPLLILSACAVAFAHGGNDVANAIGPLYVVLNYANQVSEDSATEVPLYVTALGGVAIVVGLATWGYKVMATIGTKITKLSFSKGYAAQFGASISVLLATYAGMPISTTSVIVGSVIGVGLAEGVHVDLKIFVRIFGGWMLTLPAAAVLSMLLFAALSAAYGV